MKECQCPAEVFPTLDTVPSTHAIAVRDISPEVKRPQLQARS